MDKPTRQLLAAVLALAVTTPAAALPTTASTTKKSTRSAAAKAKPEVVGIIAATQAATVRDALAPAGTTIYSGDILRTFDGGAIVAIGDSQVRFGEESRARLVRAPGRVQVEIARGSMTLRGSSRSPVEALLADAIITPGDAAIAGITVFNEKKAMVAAERGSVTLRTSYGNKSLTLRSGESVEVTLAPGPAPQGSGSSSNARLLSPGKVAILGAVLIGGISFAAWLIQHDNDLSAGEKQDLISPFRLR